jgi:hypothetical protein
MKFVRFIAALTLVWSSLSFSAPALADVAGRAWIPQDSVGVRYFSDDDSSETINVSPDGTQFFFVSYHGDVSCDCNVDEMAVFSTENMRRALARAGSTPGLLLQPLRRLIRRSGVHTSSAMFSPEWEPNGESISFQGRNERGILQLYLFDVRSGKVTALTNWTSEVSYMTREGDTVIADVLVPTPAAPPVYPVHAVTNTELLDVCVVSRRSTVASKEHSCVCRYS